MFEIGPAGESGTRLVFGGEPHTALTSKLLSIQHSARLHFGPSLVDSVVSYTTLTLFFEPLNTERDRSTAWLQENADADPDEAFLAELAARPVVVLPVWYHPSVAPDLEWLAEDKALSVDTIIDLHSDPTYFAYATGFAPGFCYLGKTSPKLAVPRLATPRSEVPTGSVALADQQTAVYPGPSPGGWRLIGSCPLRLFDLATGPSARLTVGDSVRFEPVSESEFRALGGSG